MICKDDMPPMPTAFIYTSEFHGDEQFMTRYASDLTTYKADKVIALYTAEQMRQAIDAERAKIEPYGIHVKPDGEYEVWISKTPR